MKYTIKDLKGLKISKNTVYTVLKKNFWVSESFEKNKRVFTENDVKIFLYYKKNWEIKTYKKFTKNCPKTVEKLSETVKIEEKLKEKDKIIAIRDTQLVNYAQLKQEEKKEKEKWMWKYETENMENKKMLQEKFELTLKLEWMRITVFFLVIIIFVFLGFLVIK
jgi:hypothetical protein